MQIEHALTAVGSGQTSLGIKGSIRTNPLDALVLYLFFNFTLRGLIV